MIQENPFDAEFGGIPELYLDFDNDAQRYARRAHRQKNYPTYSLFITGVHGSGKTVFMNKIGHELDKYHDTWVIAPIIRGKLGFTLPLFKEFIQEKYDKLNW
ncbi:chromosomal replication initiation ATPase DnaA [Lactobacillus colini]|uniref:Chromosomal replication initiation ATPase DnaA n=1 Tax=Lactobacillus colini TaxID=1819254 RepID=A0ABS4MCN6_9LACO|nr:hypothetical protein [Lactobacillus colini]MBP2057443.1 chromosomal replication initiation ATPase DnaA [Lactobacillus colini]